MLKIKGIYVDNFKSFKDTYIPLGDFNIVIAPNNAGKSNLMDLLRFINYMFEEASNSKTFAISSGVHYATTKLGGIGKIKNYRNNDSEMTIKVDFDDNSKLEITIGFNNNKIDMVEGWPANIDIRKNQIHITTYYFTAPTIKDRYSSYDFDTILDDDGTNLDAILEQIKETRPETWELINNSLLGIVEEINGFNVKHLPLGSNAMYFKETGTDKDIPKTIVSDGTIHLLAILTALYENDDKIFVAIEEPERHLHLKALDYIMEIFRNRSKDIQILITTQSSEIMNLTDTKTDNLIFLYRDYDGNTKAITNKQIDDFDGDIKAFGLPEIIRNEILGYLGDYLDE